MLTIPLKMSAQGELVIIPRTQYDELVLHASQRDWIYEKPVVNHLRKRIAVADKEYKSGKLIAWKK